MTQLAQDNHTTLLPQFPH